MFQLVRPVMIMARLDRDGLLNYRIAGTKVRGRKVSPWGFKQLELLRRHVSRQRADVFMRTLVANGYGRIVTGF